MLLKHNHRFSHHNNHTALNEIGKQLAQEGIEYEIFNIGGNPIRDCIGCGQCTEEGCVFSDDTVNQFIAKAKEADGFVFGTPVSELLKRQTVDCAQMQVI